MLIPHLSLSLFLSPVYFYFYFFALCCSVLKKLPHPMTMTVMQMGTNCVVLPMLMSVWNKRRRTFSRK